MLENISWAAYLTAIAVVLVIYYAVILLIFYRVKGLPRLSKGKIAANDILDSQEDLQETQGHLFNELGALIQQCAYSKSPKEELIFAIGNLLHSARFQSVSDPKFDANVNRLIIQECETNCSIHLSEDDLRMLWTR